MILFCDTCEHLTHHRDIEKTYAPPVHLVIRAVCKRCGTAGRFSTTEHALKAEGITLTTGQIYHEARRFAQITEVLVNYPTGATVAEIMQGIGLKKDRTRGLVARAKKLGLITAHKEGHTNYYERAAL